MRLVCRFRNSAPIIGSVFGAVAPILLAGCAGMQQQEVRAQLQAIVQSCIQRMQTDRDLDPIRTKIEFHRYEMSGAPPPTILSDQSRPTPDERVALAKWESIRDACTQEQMPFGLRFSRAQRRIDRALIARRTRPLPATPSAHWPGAQPTQAFPARAANSGVATG
jgi:hypothetical protein